MTRFRMTPAPARPLAALERFLLVAAFALYVGAIVLQVLEDLYVQPLVAAIAVEHTR